MCDSRVQSSDRTMISLTQVLFTIARLVSCSRWSEMTESLRFHIGLASAAGASTEFRLLNGARAEHVVYLPLDLYGCL